MIRNLNFPTWRPCRCNRPDRGPHASFSSAECPSHPPNPHRGHHIIAITRARRLARIQRFRSAPATASPHGLLLWQRSRQPHCVGPALQSERHDRRPPHLAVRHPPQGHPCGPQPLVVTTMTVARSFAAGVLDLSTRRGKRGRPHRPWRWPGPSPSPVIASRLISVQ